MRKISIIILCVLVTAMSLNAKTLIVYYSYTNNVHRIMTELQGRIDADVVRVEPAEKGLDYAANNYAIGSALISGIRNNPDDASSYPAIDPVNVDISRYNTIIIGTPLWWSSMAAPMQTFLFQHGAEMAGKHIGLIVSSASSGISGVEADARRLISEGNFLSPTLWVRSSQTSNARSMIESWLSEIDYSSLNNPEMTDNQITIKVGDTTTLTATLASNSSANALMKMLESGPVTIDMHDYANMEKVGNLPESLPRNDTYFTAQPGDLILYLGYQFVIYYDTNTYDFTYLGKVNGNYTGEALKSLLGQGNVTVTLSADIPSGIENINADKSRHHSKVYDLRGNMVQRSSENLASLTPCIYIIDGQKILVGTE